MRDPQWTSSFRSDVFARTAGRTTSSASAGGADVVIAALQRAQLAAERDGVEQRAHAVVAQAAVAHIERAKRRVGFDKKRQQVTDCNGC